MSEFNCTCLIPFYNECERLPKTLAVISQVPSLNKIICINDGSTEPNTNSLLESIATQYPRITVLSLKKNQGKSVAVARGLELVDTEWVLLLDADLQNLSARELSNILTKTAQNKSRLDMVILRRSRYSKFVTAIRHDILMSGERILRTRDLTSVFSIYTFSGYQLELAINHYMRLNNNRCFWIQTTIANTMKIVKWGVRKSLKKYREELTGYTKFAGTTAYLKQLAFFCHHPL
jgi:glycosyltransferase involved in cell wall biosynthesis